MEKSQAERLYDLLSDGLPHRTDEIQEKVYGRNHLGVARISGRIGDLRRGNWVGKKCCHIPKAKEDKLIPSLAWYQMLPEIILSPTYQNVMAETERMKNKQIADLKQMSLV
jgi:hypothetical protein